MNFQALYRKVQKVCAKSVDVITLALYIVSGDISKSCDWWLHSVIMHPIGTISWNESSDLSLLCLQSCGSYKTLRMHMGDA